MHQTLAMLIRAHAIVTPPVLSFDRSESRNQAVGYKQIYKQFPEKIKSIASFSTMLIASIAVVASIGVEAERPGQPSIRTRDTSHRILELFHSSSLPLQHTRQVCC